MNVFVLVQSFALIEFYMLKVLWSCIYCIYRVCHTVKNLGFYWRFRLDIAFARADWYGRTDQMLSQGRLRGGSGRNLRPNWAQGEENYTLKGGRIHSVFVHWIAAVLKQNAPECTKSYFNFHFFRGWLASLPLGDRHPCVIALTRWLPERTRRRRKRCTVTCI